MERDVGDLGAGGSAGREDFRGEMQTGGRRGGGSALTGEYGLVTLAIRGSIGTANIGRQRHVADSIQDVKQASHGMETNSALAKLGSVQNFGDEVVRDRNALAGWQLAARADESFPGEAVGGNRLGEQE